MPSLRLLYRPLLMISPGIFRGASANLKTPFPGPLGISWQQRSHFQNVTWATLYWVPCIQSKLIVIDECEQRRPAQDLPNQTQLTLSGRRVFRRYSFLGTPPPNSWSSSVKQTASTWILSEENIIILFLPCWSSYHKLSWLMSVNFELVKTASVKYCLSKCDKLVIWRITNMELSILQTFVEAVFRTYKK